MARNGTLDCIVIGGGHNGLVCAAYLAKAGRKVCVLERRHVLGGCATTEELWPGYKVSTAAYVISLFQPQIIRELRLRTIRPANPAAHPRRRSRRCSTAAASRMGPEPGLDQREIAKFSLRDAEAYPRYKALLERVAAVLEPALGESAPDPLPLPARWRRDRPGQAAPRRAES